MIDEEEGRLISCRLYIIYNKQTGVYTVSSALIYCNRYIGPRKLGKQNCNDPVFIKKFTDAHLKRDKKRYLKNHSPEVDNVL